MRQSGAFNRGHTMTKLIDVAIFLIGLLAALYIWPVSKALTLVVVGSLYGFLVWRIFSNAKREKMTRR
jgi:nitrate reductase NapE component